MFDVQENKECTNNMKVPFIDFKYESDEFSGYGLLNINKKVNLLVVKVLKFWL